MKYNQRDSILISVAYPLADVGLGRRGLLRLQGVQGLLRQGEGPRGGLHVQQVHGRSSGLDQVQVVGSGEPRVVFIS